MLIKRWVWQKTRVVFTAIYQSTLELSLCHLDPSLRKFGKNKRSRKRRGLVLTIHLGFSVSSCRQTWLSVSARPASGRPALLWRPPASLAVLGFHCLALPLHCTSLSVPFCLGVSFSFDGTGNFWFSSELRVTMLEGTWVFTTASSWSLTAISEGVRRSKRPRPEAWEWWRATQTGRLLSAEEDVQMVTVGLPKSFLAFSHNFFPSASCFGVGKPSRKKLIDPQNPEGLSGWSGSLCWQEMWLGCWAVRWPCGHQQCMGVLLCGGRNQRRSWLHPEECI